MLPWALHLSSANSRWKDSKTWTIISMFCCDHFTRLLWNYPFWNNLVNLSGIALFTKASLDWRKSTQMCKDGLSFTRFVYISNQVMSAMFENIIAYYMFLLWRSALYKYRQYISVWKTLNTCCMKLNTWLIHGKWKCWSYRWPLNIKLNNNSKNRTFTFFRKCVYFQRPNSRIMKNWKNFRMYCW